MPKSFYYNNTWNTQADLTPSTNKHSVAGFLNISHETIKPGKSLDSFIEKSTLCSNGLSKLKELSKVTLTNDISVTLTKPESWFEIWEINGFAFGGLKSGSIQLDSLLANDVDDNFEYISSVQLHYHPNSSGSPIISDIGCWFIDPVRKYPVAVIGAKYVGDINSGISTGGKTSSSVRNNTTNNSALNLFNSYFNPNNYYEEYNSVVPFVYENNGITWIRRENMNESVYYHIGVGD